MEKVQVTFPYFVIVFFEHLYSLSSNTLPLQHPLQIVNDVRVCTLKNSVEVRPLSVWWDGARITVRACPEASIDKERHAQNSMQTKLSQNHDFRATPPEFFAGASWLKTGVTLSTIIGKSNVHRASS